MKHLLPISIWLCACLACEDQADERVKLSICGDLVVPDEIDTLRISVIQTNNKELNSRLYVLDTGSASQGPPIADSTPVPESVPSTAMGGSMESGMDEVSQVDPRDGEGWFGDPCSDASECKHGRAECLLAEDGFPGGVCVKACGSGAGNCPRQAGAPKAFCVRLDGFDKGRCLPTCDVDIIPENGGCRPGYVCAEVPNHAGNVQRSVCVKGDVASQEPEDDMTMLAESMAMKTPEPMRELAPRPEGPTVAVEQRIRLDDNTSRVRVEGYLRGRAIVVSEVRGDGDLAVALDYACLKAVNCPEGTTCVDGDCVTIPIGGTCP